MTRRFLRLIALLFPLAAAVLTAPVTALAQQPTPEPPAAAITLRYDAARDSYLVDLIISDPAQVASAQLSLVDPNGVEVTRLAVPDARRNQSVELDAAPLIPGQSYTLLVQAFSSGGLLLAPSGESGALAEAEFVYTPASFGEVVLREEPGALVVSAPLAAGSAVSALRLRLVDEGGAVALEQAAATGSPARLPLADLAQGDYTVQVAALDGAGRALAMTAVPWQHAPPPLLPDTPLFSASADPPSLTVDLAPGAAAGGVRFRVILVNALNQVAHEAVASPDAEGRLALDMAGVPNGEYTVFIRALDAGGATLAETTADLIYVAPRPPGFFGRISGGLRDNPVLGVFIALLLLALVVFLATRALLDRRQTGTPTLAGWNLPAGDVRTLPVSGAAAVIPDTKSSGGRALPAPSLEMAVSKSPDRRREGQAVAVERFPFTIGRGGNDLDLSGDKMVSRRHAELRQTAQGLVIVDLLSVNGTYINGERIPADTEVPLSGASPVRITVGRESHLILRPSK